MAKLGDGCRPMIPLYSAKCCKTQIAALAWVILISVVIFLVFPLAAARAGVPCQRGVATWHDPGPGSTRTASKRPWAGNELIAAHRSLPLGSKIRVVNLANKRSVVVEIRDRGPYLRGRIIDISRRAAKEIGLLETGIAKVRLEPVLAEAASDG